MACSEEESLDTFISRYEQGTVFTDPRKWGTVELEDEAMLPPGIAEVIQGYWMAWLRQDTETMNLHCNDDILLLSQQLGRRVQGLDQATLLWNEEWSAFERPTGTISASNAPSAAAVRARV